MTKFMKLALGSLLIGFSVLGLKILAWWVTGSVALLSDALESTVNVVTALAALIAIRVADLPADDNHPYGHHKPEFFSAVLEGVTYAIRDCRDALAATGTKIDRLLAVGGGSKSDYWLRAIATALGTPVDLPVAGDFGGAHEV